MFWKNWTLLKAIFAAPKQYCILDKFNVIGSCYILLTYVLRVQYFHPLSLEMFLGFLRKISQFINSSCLPDLFKPFLKPFYTEKEIIFSLRPEFLVHVQLFPKQCFVPIFFLLFRIYFLICKVTEVIRNLLVVTSV